MPEFLVVVLVLALLASVFVLFPPMMNRSRVETNRSGVNITLFKDRLAELQSQQQRGDIDTEEFQRLKTELERRLLEEAGDTPVDTATPIKVSTTAALCLAVLIPLIAYGVYHQTGAVADWRITETMNQVKANLTAGVQSDAEMERLLQQVSARLEQRPDSADYLMLLANTQMQLQNYPAAADAFQRLSVLVPEDASVLAQQAQALYLASNRSLTDQVMAIAERALAANPQQPTVLGLLGIASFEEGDYQQAINYWQRLLPLLPQGSPNRQMIQAGIDQAATLQAASGAKVDTNTAAASGSQASLQVEVTLAAGITADTDATVFVFARALSGPKMPLAVARLKVADLPASVTLDNSMAMAPGLTLSSVEQVEVVARISKNGIANRGSGDIEGKSGPIVVAMSTPLSVIIDQVLP